ncbi:MAG: hypothetical protein K0Q83_2237 [Deltaproteobacteria bacterium]|jgi:hypothetical protein|nr:hypothetical protein [Deltaproteobacteria bacterium]
MQRLNYETGGAQEQKDQADESLQIVLVGRSSVPGK